MLVLALRGSRKVGYVFKVGQLVRHKVRQDETWIYAGMVGIYKGPDPEYPPGLIQPEGDVIVEMPDGTLTYTTDKNLELVN